MHQKLEPTGYLKCDCNLMMKVASVTVTSVTVTSVMVTSVMVTSVTVTSVTVTSVTVTSVTVVANFLFLKISPYFELRKAREIGK